MTENYRIISETRASYLLEKAGAECPIPKSSCREPYYVGDLVTYDGQKLALLERRNKISKASNRTVKNYRDRPKEQVLATNVDQLFILIALDQNFSLAKLERFYLVFYQEVIDLHFILSKKDLVADYQKTLDEIDNLYPHLSLTAINSHDPEDIRTVKNLLKAKQTRLLLGASGAGKSTLLNHLLRQAFAMVNTTRSDGKGRHTTTSSRLHYSSALDYTIIDSPGFKGIDKVTDLDLSPLYQDILDLAQLCHFPNCRHDKEKKCAVKEALATGRLNQGLFDRYSYHQNQQ